MINKIKIKHSILKLNYKNVRHNLTCAHFKLLKMILKVKIANLTINLLKYCQKLNLKYSKMHIILNNKAINIIKTTNLWILIRLAKNPSILSMNERVHLYKNKT